LPIVPALRLLSAAAGVRTIEHGNLIDDQSAQLMADNDAFLVSTLVAYGAMRDYGEKYNFPLAMQLKNEEVIASGLASLEIAANCGVKIGFGTDLLGELHAHQNKEFSIRAERQAPIDIIRAATLVNAEIIGESGKLGCIETGAHADLLLLDSSPLDDIDVLAMPQQHVPMVMKAGEVVAAA